MEVLTELKEDSSKSLREPSESSTRDLLGDSVELNLPALLLSWII